MKNREFINANMKKFSYINIKQTRTYKKTWSYRQVLLVLEIYFSPFQLDPLILKLLQEN